MIPTLDDLVAQMITAPLNRLCSYYRKDVSISLSIFAYVYMDICLCISKE